MSDCLKNEDALVSDLTSSNVDILSGELQSGDSVNSEVSVGDSITSNVSYNDVIDSSLLFDGELTSELGDGGGSSSKYIGQETDNIVVTVDNNVYTVSASLKPIKFNSVADFPTVGSDKLIYIDFSNKTLYGWNEAKSVYYKLVADVEIPTKLSAFENDAGFIDENTAKSYTDTKIAELIDSAPETLDTFREIAEAFEEDQAVLDALNNAIGNKADKSEIPDISVKADKSELNNYVTNTALESKGYVTTSELNSGLDGKANKTDLTPINTSISTIQTKLNGIEDGAEKNKVQSVNGKTGAVVLSAGDVGALSSSTKLFSGSYNDLTNKPTIPTTATEVSALPNTTKYGASLDLTLDETNYKVTVQLKDQSGNNLGVSKTIDLPLESVVVNGGYDSTNKKVVLTLQNGTEISFSVADLVSGLQSKITTTNKLDSDLISDTYSTNKFVTADNKTYWNNKVDYDAENLKNYYKKSETYTQKETQDLLDLGLSTKANKTDLNAYVTDAELETTLSSKKYVTENMLDGYVTESELDSGLANVDSGLRTELSKKANASDLERLASDVSNVSYNLSTVKNKYLTSVFITNDGKLLIYDQDQSPTLFEGGGGTNVIWREWT